MTNEEVKWIKGIEDRAKSNTHQIEDLKPIVKEIHAMSNSITKMAENLTNVNDSIGDIKKDVEKLDNKITAVEKAPADDVRYYKRLIIGGIITTVIGTIFGALITIILK